LGETEGLSDWEMSLEHDEWSTSNWLFTNDNTSSLGDATVNTTYSIIWGLDFDQEDWLLEAWGSGKLTSVEGTSHGWGNLTTTSVDSVSVESDILDVETDTSHVLLGHATFLGGPLEGSLARVLDFVQELASLGDINKEIWTSGFWTEAPDLHGIIWIPLEVLLESLLSLFDIHLWSDLLILNLLSELISEWASLGEDSVVLVWRLGQALLAGLGGDSFLVRDDWVTLLEWALGVLLLKILEANLDVQFTATGNNVLTGLFSGADDQWVGLGELAETFDELWKIGSRLDLNGNTHDWGNGELHDTDAVSLFVVGDGTLLGDELIDTNKTDSVTAWHIWDSLNLTGHHEDGSLNVLDVEIGLGTWLVVWSHNSDLLTS
jgi:hypothetical protein